jgi:SAM-dependent methyltransferase
MTLNQLPILEGLTPRTDLGPGGSEAMQALTRELAFDTTSWTPERVARMIEVFDGLAPEWHTRAGEERLRPLRDALARGGVPPAGVCAEVGSGTGLQTPVMTEHFGSVISTDLSSQMLARSPRRPCVSLVHCDASRLPLAGGSVDAVVVVNMFLFPREYTRVLRAGGRLVFVSIYGTGTPIYLPPADVVAAVEAEADVAEAITSGDGVATWTVVTKRGFPDG